MSVQIFIDPIPDLPDHQAQLFRDFGLEAYGMIFLQQYQESAEVEEANWNRFKSLADKPEEEDEEVDYGPEEPDDYGE